MSHREHLRLQDFSCTVAELYEHAVHLGPREFAAEVVQLLRRVIVFDGAILGVGNADTTLAKNLVIDQSCIHGKTIKDVDEEVSLCEPFPPAFFEQMKHPLTCDVATLEGRREALRWSDFVRRYNMHRLLIYGDAPTERGNARWIMLYRMAENDFDEADGEVLCALWTHIRQALAFNLGRALSHSNPDRIERANALVNSRGLIEAADQAMTDLLKLEWPGFNERSMPVEVVAALVRSGSFHGKRIELTGFQKFGYMACTARCIPLVKSLAPSEMNVAHRFAHGMTHKEIAAHLNVSPHTVRNQLAQVYQKLGVHGKAELARMMSRT